MKRKRSDRGPNPGPPPAERRIADEQPPLTEEDRRRAIELSEKYGWERYRKKRPT